MRSNLRHLGTFSVGTLIMAALSLTLFGCPKPPKYPACKTDEHCTAKVNGNDKDEYCVQEQCQECIETSHCADGYECNGGRCDAKPECTADDQCAENQLCESEKCVDVDCTTDDDCGAGEKCDSGKCIASGCTSDQECGAGMVCESGDCVEGDNNPISAECRDSSGSGVALQSVSFNFNTAELTIDTQGLLDRNAECIKQIPSITLTIEGHCDERGTQEYNLALGEKRANSVRRYLQNLGIDVSGIRTVSKGKNEPVCRQSTESCFEKNRRVEFIQ